MEFEFPALSCISSQQNSTILTEYREHIITEPKTTKFIEESTEGKVAEKSKL